MRMWFAILLGSAVLLVGCAAKKRDYGAYFAHEPRSIVVVPPLNETTSIDAQSVYLTTISRPLAERGFYVFPVLLTDALLKDLGLPEAGLVHQVPPEKFYEYFGADAVLFVTISDWTNRYLLLQAQTVVTVSFALKDTRSGALLWEGTQSAVQGSGDGGGGLIGMAIAAAITYAANEMLETNYRPLAQQANAMALSTPGAGLPLGPYHPGHGTDRNAYGR